MAGKSRTRRSPEPEAVVPAGYSRIARGSPGKEVMTYIIVLTAILLTAMVVIGRRWFIFKDPLVGAIGRMKETVKEQRMRNI